MPNYKAIILAGGTGSRLFPATKAVTKQLLPVYDKPAIYYPLSTIILAEIRDILMITTPAEQSLFQHLLGDGSQWGINLNYATQDSPRGIAEALLIGRSFIGNDAIFLMLGDNIFYGHRLTEILPQAKQANRGATVFGFKVNNPRSYGVIGFDDNGQVNRIIEKPETPPSRYAVAGSYFYDNQAIDLAAALKPSPRGELEISDLNQRYIEQQRLDTKLFNRGIAWFDIGTADAMLEAANFIQILEKRQGLRIGSPEEAAWRKGYITDEQLTQLAQPLIKSGYGQYLLELADES
ncbi:MAG: glucose-1-phosphate thymidylyltransferase RfbA [Gammaproteobacteria bacterium]|nr:glucose-1-phosphate thymidylyltransferase RfbA [Gammaproteobacteria bacterium]